MLKFKDYLIEGGNIGADGVKPESLSVEDRAKKSEDIRHMAHEMNRKSGHVLYGKHGNAINKGTAFSGSTKHYMDKSIKDEDFKKVKPHGTGDVDIQVPREHKEKVEHLLKPGTKHGNFSVVHTKKHGEEISAVMKHHPSGKHHQVDFEYTDFHKKTHEPTEFSQMYHNSHMEDLKHGLKGAHHKMLLSAVTHKDHKPDTPDNRTHSCGYQGLKDKKTGEADKDIASIHHKMFGKKADKSDIEHMHSFKGVAHLMKKHLSPEQQKNVVHSYSTGKSEGHEHSVNKLKEFLK